MITPSERTGHKRTKGYEIKRYIHTHNPLVYRYEFVHIRSAEVLVSTLTSSKKVPKTIRDAEREKRRV